MKFIHANAIFNSFLLLPTLISGACNPESCAGALGGAVAGEVPGAAALDLAVTSTGCAAATLLSPLMPFLIPVDIICWALAGASAAAVSGGAVALAGTAGGCFDCKAAKPCDKNDAVARSHGCGGVSLFCSPSRESAVQG